MAIEPKLLIDRDEVPSLRRHPPFPDLRAAPRTGIVGKTKREAARRMAVPPPVVKAAPVRLSARSSVEDAQRAIVAKCLLQVRGNEPGVVLGDAAESVHQMRVGVRRLRFALRLFCPVAPRPGALDAELKWLAAELGAARDWEVLACETLATIEHACPGETGLANLRAAAQRLARENRKRATGAITSRRYARLLRALGRWLANEPARKPAPTAEQTAPTVSLAKYSARTLKRWHVKLLACGGAVESATPEVRHQARKVARRARYAAEFFASLYPPGRVRPYVKVLIAVQDELGRLNDAAVARALLRDLVQADDGLAESADFVSGFLLSSARRDARRLARRWRRFEQVERPKRS